MSTYWQALRSGLELRNLIENPSFEKGIDGYTAVAGGTLEQSADRAAKGVYAGKYTPTNNTGDGVYRAITLAPDTTYTFGLSIFASAANIPYRIYFYDITAAAIRGTAVAFTGDNEHYRRQVVTVTTGSNTSYRLYVVKNGSASTAPFYIDALQLVASDKDLSYIDGDQDGCTWLSTPHASVSILEAQSAAGGEVITLSEDDYIKIQDNVGTGEPPKEIIDTLPAQGDGGDYQRTITRPREFQLIGIVKGDKDGTEGRVDYHRKRQNLTRLFNPHRLATDQPVQIRYRLDGRVVAIDSVHQGGLEKGPLENYKTEKITLRFKAEDPYWRAEMGVANGDVGGGPGDGQGALLMEVQEAVADANYIIQRSAGGEWGDMDSGLTLPSVGSPSGGAVLCGAIGPDGAIYLGGIFTSYDGVSNTSKVARWDGLQFKALSTGCNGTVRAIIVTKSGIVFVAGDFSSAGGVADTSRIASYDPGTDTFSPLDVGASGGNIFSLALSPDETILYASGSFTSIGGITVRGIAQYTIATDTWSKVGSGAGLGSGTAQAVVSDGTNVYIAGAFTTVDGVTTNEIARFNGSAWSGLGNISGASVFALGLSPDFATLYAGGQFADIDGVTGTAGIGRCTLSGPTWAAMGTGVDDFYVLGMMVSPTGRVYAGGAFNGMSGVDATAGVAVWIPEDSAWEALGAGIAATTIDNFFLAPWGGLYVVGNFVNAGPDADANYLAYFNGSRWRAANIAVRVIFRASDGSIYVGGGFDEAGGVSDTACLVKWDPITEAWISITGSGIDGIVYTIVETSEGKIIVGGSFSEIDGVSGTQGIAEYDPVGDSWSDLDGGLAGTVLALAVEPATGYIYIGGVFLGKNFCYWDGSAYQDVSTGANGPVNALAFEAAGGVYIGGAFTQLGEVDCNYIGYLFEGAFQAVGEGVNGYVNALVVRTNNNVVLAGQFTQAGGVEALYIAVWNGSQIAPLSTGLNAPAYALALEPVTGAVYVGGIFTEAGGVLLPDKVAIYLGGVFFPVPVDLPGNAAVEAILISPAGEYYFGFDTEGTATPAAVSTAENLGSANTFPTFRLIGPGRIYELANLTTKRRIFFDLVLLDGDEAKFDFRPGRQAAVSSFQGEIADTILEGSDTEDFYLMPGENVISLLVDDTGAVASLEWPELHWGIDGVVGNI